MPNSWLFNWESMATREKENLEKRCVESFLGVYMYCCFLSMVDAKPTGPTIMVGVGDTKTNAQQ